MCGVGCLVGEHDRIEPDVDPSSSNTALPALKDAGRLGWARCRSTLNRQFWGTEAWPRRFTLNPAGTFEGVHQLGDEVEFPPPIGANGRPAPRGDLCPMKPWDRLLPDDQIESEALGRVKATSTNGVW